MENPSKIFFRIIITIILTLGLSLSLQSVLADFLMPTEAPPSSNVSPPVFTEKGTGQSITHGLIINSSGGDAYGLAVFQDAQIGTVASSSDLFVSGDFQVGPNGDQFIVTGGAVGIGDNTPDNPLGGAYSLDVQGGVQAVRYYDDNPAYYLDGDGTSYLNVVSTNYLKVQPQDTVYEGGEIQLVGAGGYGTIQLDNYQGNARIFLLSPGKNFEIVGGGGLCINGDCRASWPSTVGLATKSYVDTKVNAAETVFGMGIIKDGQTIPLPAGVTDQNNCAWTVSWSGWQADQPAISYSSYPTYYYTSATANRVVFAHADVPGHSFAGSANYLIICHK